MPDAFRSFASIFARPDAGGAPVQHFVRAPAPRVPSASATCEPPSPATAPPAAAAAVAAAPEAAVRIDERVSDLLDAFVADLARLRARAAERLEECADALLADLASRVLARELCAAPADVGRLIDEAVREFPAAGTLVVHVCDADATRLESAWPVAVDSKLQPGDFALELDDGRFEASLQTRLSALLASHRFAL